MFPILTQLISVTYEKNSSRIVVVQTKIRRRRTRHVVRSRRSKRDVYQNGNLARKSRLVPGTDSGSLDRHHWSCSRRLHTYRHMNPFGYMDESDTSNNTVSQTRTIPGAIANATAGTTGRRSKRANITLSGSVVGPGIRARLSGSCHPLEYQPAATLCRHQRRS